MLKSASRTEAQCTWVNTVVGMRALASVAAARAAARFSAGVAARSRFLAAIRIRPVTSHSPVRVSER